MLKELIRPAILPPLDAAFQPAALSNRSFRSLAAREGVPFVIGLERKGNELSRYETSVFPEGHPYFAQNYAYIDRLIKFLLWQHGGYRIYLGGSKALGEYIRDLYSHNGERAFDSRFMGDQVYEAGFEVCVCTPEEVPAEKESGKMLGGHWDGCRVGFDLGASDYKLAAVIDGESVFNEETIWEPQKHSDPSYYYHEILGALQRAASKMPRLDAIGGSSAGIYIDNRPVVSSLFRAVPSKHYSAIKDLFINIQKEMKVPLEVINDGEVTALAGAMSIGEGSILGIALGSSEAAGFVDADMHITGWLNELAFAPIDYSSEAPIDAWSGDRGCGASYFSQQAVFRLAPRAGIDIPAELSDAEKLKYVQEKLEAGNEGAIKIWQSMGVYLGYALAHYADFYDFKHVLIVGRCTSGCGGELLVEGAKAVLEAEFPELYKSITLHLPNEKFRRLGQAVAAASLPDLSESRQ
jgi:predicted NBD/HSP70 family sugar kinase